MGSKLGPHLRSLLAVSLCFQNLIHLPPSAVPSRQWELNKYSLNELIYLGSKKQWKNYGCLMHTDLSFISNSTSFNCDLGHVKYGLCFSQDPTRKREHSLYLKLRGYNAENWLHGSWKMGWVASGGWQPDRNHGKLVSPQGVRDKEERQDYWSSGSRLSWRKATSQVDFGWALMYIVYIMKIIEVLHIFFFQTTYVPFPSPLPNLILIASFY